jgi:hypothetical protein
MLSVQATPDVANIRTATLFEVEHTIVPCVALVEGVLWPANAPAPELALAEEFGRFPDGWNGRPVVFDHPKINGVAVSASHPEVMEEVAFGSLFNTTVEDGKLKCEIWINNVRVASMDEDVQDAVARLQSGDQTIEVSTGLFTMTEVAKGEFEGEEFEAIWRNIVPDHLAVLPRGVVGACSVEDGCGAPRSNKSKTEFIPVMRAAEMNYQGNGAGTNTTTLTIDSDACECHTTKGTQATKGTFQKVMEAVTKVFDQDINVNEDLDDVTEFVPDQKLELEANVNQLQENITMEKDQLVQGLIDNASSQFTEDDRDWLSTLEESQLAKLEPVKVDTEEEVTENIGTVVGEEEVVEVEEVAAAPVSTDDYIAGAPEEVQAVLNSGLRMHRERKKALVDGLLTNSRCTFSAEQLNGKALDELEAIANLAGSDITFEGSAPMRTQSEGDEGFTAAPQIFDLNKSAA